jgi:hypothetical protein
MLKGPGMTQENAARKIEDGAAARMGIHLVHSRDWCPARRASVAAVKARREAKITRRARRGRMHISESKVLLGAALAALSVPLLWIGHAMLHWKHVL